jgi:hypothetical protein
MRREVLAYFQWRSAEGAPRGHLYRILDPKLQAILEEVWAPKWDGVTDEQIAGKLSACREENRGTSGAERSRQRGNRSRVTRVPHHRVGQTERAREP